MRFWRLEQLTTFGGDQGYDFLIAKGILQGKFTLLGPKIGPYNNFGNLYLGPAYYYLIAPWLFLFQLDPIGPAFFTVMTALATISLIFIIANQFLSKRIAILASAIYGLNAILIEQSRASSNPHLIPFFAAVSVYSYLKTSQDKSKSILWPLLAGFSVGIAFQLHYLAISLLIVILIFNLLNSKYKAIILVFIGLMLALGGQILFEFRHNFFVTNLFLIQMHQGKVLSLATVLKNINSSARLLTSAFIFSPILIFILFNKNLLKKQLITFLLTSTILGFFLVVIYPGNPQPHYFAPIYVSVILLISTIFSSFLDPKQNFFIKFAVMVILTIYFLINISSYHLLRKNGYTMPDGWNLTGIKFASKAIANDVDNERTFNVAATLDGDTRAMPYRYMLSVYGKTPLGVEKYPQAQVIYLVSRDSLDEIKNYSVWEIASFWPYNISKIADVQNGIRVYKLTKTN